MYEHTFLLCPKNFYYYYSLSSFNTFKNQLNRKKCMSILFSRAQRTFTTIILTSFIEFGNSLKCRCNKRGVRIIVVEVLWAHDKYIFRQFVDKSNI